ncbi:MAG TPA: urate oxidase [Roseiflexaceae bacterium]|nr:urate oxidase [Roseiflexaceae bacterium]HMP40331.1 urate oxidase [Roseiflexaceae bacterium]
MPLSISYDISYGKLAIPVYRVYATPLSGVAAIPESAFSGRPNILFALEVDVEVFGDNFLPAYTRGDNSQVVATDSMKNFVLRETLAYQGATIEGLLAELGHKFLATYPQMHGLRLSGRELPFPAAQVPQAGGFGASDLLFRRSHDDYTTAQIDFVREGEQSRIAALRSGRVGMQLLKVTGSAFTSFVRDGYTTLPERRDRPLFIYADVSWSYTDPADAVASDHSRYIAAEQVADLMQVVFHEFVSESIQHLLHEIGIRLLERFPQMASVSFEAQNRTRDPMAESSTDPRIKVYSDPFSAYGLLRLTLTRGAS